MFKLAAISWAFLLATHFAYATSAQSEQPSVAETPLLNTEPLISAKFYSSEEVLASPFLMALKPFEPGCNKIVFELQNFPLDEEIVMEISRLGNEGPETRYHAMTFSLQNDGSFITSEKQFLKVLSASSQGFLPGERATYRFYTNNGSVDKEISGIPNPVAFKEKNGRVALKAELVSILPTVYTIEIPALNDDEGYEIKTVIVGETMTGSAKYSSKAPIHFSPSVKRNVKGGNSYFEVRRHSGEVYFLKLPWGTALNNYSNGIKTYLPID